MLEKEELCAGVATDTCLRLRIKQMLSEMFRVWQLAALEKCFALLRYDLTARQTTAKNGTESEERLKNPRSEARVKLGGNSEGDVLYA